MKKIKLIATIFLLVISMIGCEAKKVESKEEQAVSNTFAKAVEEGKLAIADNDYEKASNMFALALEENKDDEISKLNEQCELVIKMLDGLEKFENTEYTDETSMNDDLNKILDLCEKIISIDSKSNLIKDKAKEAKKELDDAKEAIETIKDDSKDNNVKNNSSNKKDEYLQKLNEIEDEVSKISYDGDTLQMKEASSKVLKKWDDALNEIYAVLKSQLSSSEMELLKEEQIQWISIRDAGAEECASEFEGGTMYDLEYTEALARQTKQRCYELVDIYMK